MLAGAAGWDRANEDLKRVIGEISKILDTRNVPWSIRVAQVIGRARPAGQLASFLGDEVVESLWGPSSQAEVI
jgi:hypothetical protein